MFIDSLFLLCFVFSEALANPNPFPLNKPLIKKLKNQGGNLLSNRIGEYILRAENLASSKKYDKAIELLEFHYNKAEKSEKDTLAVQLAYLYKQADNNNKALEYFKKVSDSKYLDYNQRLSILYYKAQIYIEKGNYDKGLEFLKSWFSINEKPNPSSYILLAHCYYAKNNIPLALKYVEITLSLVTKPKESWLMFAVALYLKENNYKKARPYLERLVALYPTTASHWRQLAGVYLYLDEPKKAFVTLDIAHKMGYLKNKTEYLILISLYIEQGLPYEGAKLLQKKIEQKIIPENQKHLELIAGAFYLAREGEESLRYLKQASKTAKDSKFFLNYGQKLLEQEKWELAEKELKKALQTKDIKETVKKIENYQKSLAQKSRLNPFQKEKNYSELSIKNPDSKNNDNNQQTQTTKNNESIQKAPPTNYLEHIYLGIGIALYNQQKYTEALFYFKKSIEIKDTFLSGYQWIDYTEISLLEQKKKQFKESL